MRLDKYLKVSRLIKRRSVANEACAAGRATVSGKVAKPSTEVKAGDEITLRFGNRLLRAEVLSVAEFAKKEDSASMYRIIEQSGSFDE